MRVQRHGHYRLERSSRRGASPGQGVGPLARSLARSVPATQGVLDHRVPVPDYRVGQAANLATFPGAGPPQWDCAAGPSPSTTYRCKLNKEEWLHESIKPGA